MIAQQLQDGLLTAVNHLNYGLVVLARSPRKHKFQYNRNPIISNTIGPFIGGKEDAAYIRRERTE